MIKYLYYEPVTETKWRIETISTAVPPEDNNQPYIMIDVALPVDTTCGRCQKSVLYYNPLDKTFHHEHMDVPPNEDEKYIQTLEQRILDLENEFLKDREVI